MNDDPTTATSDAGATSPNIYPCLSYRDARAAIDWLGEAFGFEELMVHPGEDREIGHAELSLGPGIVMLGSASEAMPEIPTDAKNDAGELDFSRVPFALYVAVEDVDAHHDRARAAGAEIVRPLSDTDYGAREYGCRDLEGNVWSFGNYRPVAG